MAERDLEGFVEQTIPRQKEEPWVDHGLHLGIKIKGNALGWALLSPRNTRIKDEGRQMVGDASPEDAALKRWQEADCPPSVTLYKYGNWDAFSRSPDKEGLTLEEHGQIVDRVAAKLRRHGATVTIEVVEYL